MKVICSLCLAAPTVNANSATVLGSMVTSIPASSEWNIRSVDETVVNETNKTSGQTHAVNTKVLLNLLTNFTGCDVTKWLLVQYTKPSKIYKNNYGYITVQYPVAIKRLRSRYQRGFIYTEHTYFGRPCLGVTHSFVSSDAMRSHLSPFFASLEKGYRIYVFSNFRISANMQSINFLRTPRKFNLR